MNQLGPWPAGRALRAPSLSSRDSSLRRAGEIALAVQVLLASTAVLAQASTAGATEPPATALPEIRVIGEKQREAGSRVELTQEDIERTGATSMGEVMRYQPLVEAPGTVQGATRGASRYDRSGTTGYNIRGIEGNRIGLDVDGIEMPDAVSRAPLTNRAQDGTFGMGRDFIDPDLYSSVEIQSGTTNSQRTAGGIGGAVSFRSKSPEDYVSVTKPFYAGARLGYSDSNKAWTQGVTAAGLQGDFGLLLSYVRRDGEATRNNSSIESYPDDWHSDALLLKGTYRLSAAHRLELAADLYRKQSDSVFETWNAAATAVSGLSSQDASTRRDTVSVAHTWTPGPGAWIDSLGTRLYFQATEMDDHTDTRTIATGVVSREVSRNSTRQVGFSSVGDKRLGNHLLKFGVNYSETRNEHPFSSTTDTSTRQPFPDTLTRRAGMFFEDTIEMQLSGRRFAVVPGLRVDRIEPSLRNSGSFDNRLTQAQLEQLYGNAPANTIVSPSLSLLYDVQPRLTAYAQWKHGGRAPTNSEIFGYWNGGGPTYALVGNKELRKETSDAFDIGLKGTPTEGVTFSGSVFYTRYKDFISYTRFTRASRPDLFVDVPAALNILYQADNRDKATIYGTELSARLDHGVWTPAARGLYSTWAFGYSKGKSRSYYAGDKDVDLDSVQPAKAIVGVGYDAPAKAWGLNFTGTFVRGKQAVATNRQAFGNNPGEVIADSATQLFDVPGYARFDLAGYWRASKNIRLSAGIYNLGDKKYWAYSSTRSLQPSSAQDQRQIALSTAPGRTFAVNMTVEF